MAVTVTERPDSGSGSDGERKRDEKRYQVRGTADGVAARNALRDNSPPTYGGHPRKAWDVDPVYVDAQNPGRCLWEGVVRYGPAETERIEPEIGETLIRSRSGGGTEHMVVPIARRGAYGPAGDTAPEAHGIGDDGEGNVEGVDVKAPRYEFTVTKVFTNPATAPSDDTLRALADTVNSAEFSVTDSRTGRTITCAAGECLFRGHEAGAARGDGGLEITYNFAVRPNRGEFTIPGTDITVTDGKKGWDYLWCRYAQAEDDTAKRLYAKAIGAYVDQVYYETDFTTLGI